jgi:hypothetical protein
MVQPSLPRRDDEPRRRRALKRTAKFTPIATRRKMRAFREEIRVMTRGIQGEKLEVVYQKTGLSYLVRYFPSV